MFYARYNSQCRPHTEPIGFSLSGWGKIISTAHVLRQRDAFPYSHNTQHRQTRRQMEGKQNVRGRADKTTFVYDTGGSAASSSSSISTKLDKCLETDWRNVRN